MLKPTARKISDNSQEIAALLEQVMVGTAMDALGTVTLPLARKRA